MFEKDQCSGIGEDPEILAEDSWKTYEEIKVGVMAKGFSVQKIGLFIYQCLLDVC